MTTFPDPLTAAERSLEAVLEQRPPEPARHRFQPLRMGLMGIWQYENQEFSFHDGRLVLRGRNGSGKTKVLEVTSPFLFDANLTARRLDPFGTSARSMRDNLLYGNRKHRVGYVWCEYGRLGRNGVAEYRTLGAGMRAQSAKSGTPDSWYFLTDRRVGVDVELQAGPERRPLSDRELADSIGAQQVFGTADAYRAAVGQELFGLPPDRFRSLVELLVTLRRPKLSENFGVERLTTILSDGLPPVDQGLVDDLARGFDELARDQEELQDLVRTGQEVERFLDSYRVYAQRVARHTSAKVRSTVTRLDDVTRDEVAARRTLTESEDAVCKLVVRRQEIDGEQSAQGARVRALEQRPEMEQHGLLLTLQQRAAGAEEQAARAEVRFADSAHDLAGVAEELAQVTEALEMALGEQLAVDQIALAKADVCGLRIEHEMQDARLHEDSSAARKVLETVIGARKDAAKHARALRRETDRVQADFDRAQATRDDFVARRDFAAENVTRLNAELQSTIEAVSTAILSWAADGRELRWTDREVTALIEAAERAGEPGAVALADLVRAYATNAQNDLLLASADVRREHSSVVDERTSVMVERTRIAVEKDLPPPSPHVPRRDRTKDDHAGAALWQVVDFADEVSSEVRDQVEIALLGAGLLDAWITPDGSAIAADTLDVVLRADAPALDGPTLSAVLRPAHQDRVPAEVLRRVLDRVRYAEEGPSQGEPRVGSDGTWSIGPLSGRSHGGTASYIGAAAREAARRRRLAELDERLAELDHRAADLALRLETVEGRISALEQERNSCPADESIRAARSAHDAALELAGQLAAEVKRAEERLAVRRGELAGAMKALTTYTTEHSLGTTFDALDRLDEALSLYREAVTELMAKVAQTRLIRAREASVRGREERLRIRHEMVTAERHEAGKIAVEARAEYSARRELVGADVDQVMAELAQARGQIKLLRLERERLDTESTSAFERLGSAKSDLKAVLDLRATREQDRADAVEAFDQMRKHGFLQLAGMFGVEEGAGNLTRSVDEARRAEQLLRDVDVSEKARNAGRNAVDERFRELQRKIEGPDWRPWGHNDGELFVVRVNHNGFDRTLPELQSIVEDEVSTRRGYLDDRERKLFAEVLLGRLGEHLRQCRVEAGSLCDRMNELLSAMPTASGLRMQLAWKPDPEAGPDVHRAISLLDQQSARFLSDEARDELVGFLAARVRASRDDDTVGDWREHLREALDYRKWSKFHLQVRTNSTEKWTDLTDSKHQQGSGGEKAVMLQLPLFVAAAAHYEAAATTAPRPVYLDEAFAGIDAEMRGSCMKLLTDLDLDFVLASHDEWGFHAEVPGLMTYSLYRDPAVEGVLTTPFVWDGRRSHELQDPALKLVPVGSGEDTLFDE